MFAVDRSAGNVEEDQRAERTQAALAAVADPVASLCRTDPTVRARLGDEVCFTAQRAADRLPPIGRSGAAGADGRGIVGTSITGDGRLLVRYSDGAQVAVGAVAGPGGGDGRGILASTIEDGRLVLTFSDGEVQDLGPVVGATGAAGRGIASTVIVDGRLVVTYTDGATEDAGPVPPGPPGADAELPDRVVRNYPDGTSETCTRSGAEPVTYDCTERG